MDNLIKKIEEGRNIRPTTLNIYKKNLNNLSNYITKNDYTNNNFLKETTKIMDFLNDKSNSVKKKYLSSILIALSPSAKNQPTKDNEELYNTYKNLLNDENNIYLDKIKNNNKSDKDIKNWTSWNNIISVRDKLLKQIKSRSINFNKTGVKNKRDFNLVQDYIISALYTYLPPRRLEYADTILISEKDFNNLDAKNKNDNIYLVSKNKSNKYFSFGKNAVKSETPNNLKIDIPKKLNSVINFWNNTNRTKYLLVNNKGEKLTKNMLGKKIQDIFNDTGKNISVVLLRKIYLSNKFGDVLKERKEVSEQMNHSLNTANTYYIKN
tara:strand:- start:1531 stop:2499 length:969 start_codon:yes stop_codon:yes gene_type:complete